MEAFTAWCEATVSQGWAPFCTPALWGFIYSGWLITVQVALSSIALSLVFGVALALMRMSRFRLISWPTAAFVETMRAMPVFLLILYTFLAGPRIGLQLSALAAAIVALTLYTSAVLSEIVRAGIGSLGRGQMEAARALGLSYPQAMRHVILPQALRNMTPAIVSQLITLVKDTSLAGTASLGLNEMTRRAGIIYNNYFNPLETLFVVACIYWVMCYSLSLLSRRLERGRAGPAIRVRGEADQVLTGGLGKPA